MRCRAHANSDPLVIDDRWVASMIQPCGQDAWVISMNMTNGITFGIDMLDNVHAIRPFDQRTTPGRKCANSRCNMPDGFIAVGDSRQISTTLNPLSERIATCHVGGEMTKIPSV
jgi:hypothetical protein